MVTITPRPGSQRQPVTMGFKATFFVCYAGYISLYLARRPFSLSKASIEDDLGWSKAELGAVDSAQLIAYAGGVVMLSPLLAKGYPLSALLAVSLLGSAIACGVFAISDNYAMCLSSWFFSGLFQSVAYPLYLRVLLGWNITDSQLGTWLTCQQVGGIAASCANAAAIRHFGTWRSSFAVGALVSVPVGLAHAAFLSSSDSSTGKAQPTNTAAASAPGAPVTTGGAFRIKHVPHLCGAYFILKLIRYTLIGWLPYFLQKELAFTSETAGLVSLLFDLGGAAGTVGAGVLCEKFYPQAQMLLSSKLLLAAALLLVSFRSTAATLSAGGMVLQGLFFFYLLTIGAVVSGLDMVLSGKIGPQVLCQRAKLGNDSIVVVSAVINCCGSFGAVLQGAMTAAVLEAGGWVLVFGSLGMLAVIASAIIMLVHQQGNGKTM
jgi:sugar phosphate permease